MWTHLGKKHEKTVQKRYNVQGGVCPNPKKKKTRVFFFFTFFFFLFHLSQNAPNCVQMLPNARTHWEEPYFARFGNRE
jgi:hypothetical protein